MIFSKLDMALKIVIPKNLRKFLKVYQQLPKSKSFIKQLKKRNVNEKSLSMI